MARVGKLPALTAYLCRMTRFALQLSALVVLSAACGDDGATFDGPDSGVEVDADVGADASTDAGAGPTDAATPTGTDASTDAGTDAGPETTNPADCPVGPADGCCPLLRYGGTDPDCDSLDCDALEASEVIELDDLEGGERSTAWKGGTGVAWTGEELALARTDWNADGDGRDIVFELRAPNGNLVTGPVRTPEVTTSSLSSRPAGEAALGYVVGTDRFVYANATSRSYDVVGIERDGSLAFATSTNLAWCNWNSGGWVDVLPTDDRALVVGNRYTCAGSTNTPVATEVLADGSAGLEREYGTGGRTRNCWAVSAACDADCATPRFLYHCSFENQLQLRGFDPTTFDADPHEVLDTGYHAHPRGTAVASDGERFFVVQTPGSLSTGDGSLIARPYRPGVGWEGEEYTQSNVIAEQMRIVWTGSGYLLAAVLWDRESGETSTPLGDRHRFHIQLWHFDPDGNLRETFDLDPGMPGLHPNLAWAGGRVAMTWVRPIDHDGSWESDEPRRYLRFFSCP